MYPHIHLDFELNINNDDNGLLKRMILKKVNYTDILP